MYSNLRLYCIDSRENSVCLDITVHPPALPKLLSPIEARCKSCEVKGARASVPSKWLHACKKR